MNEIEEKLYQQLMIAPAGSDEFDKILKQLVSIKQLKKKSWWNDDATRSALLQLAAILVVLNFEKIGVVTSKSMGFIPRARN